MVATHNCQISRLISEYRLCVAKYLKNCTFHKESKMLKVPFSRISTLGTRLAYSIRTITNKELTELDPIGMDDAVLQEENIAKRKLDLDKKRNKSGLSSAHFNLMHGRPPYSEPWHRSHYTTVYQRKRYGKFGSASNVDPRICWMDKEELASKLEYDSLAEDRTVPEMIKMAKEKRFQEEKKIAERDNQIQSKIMKLSAWEADLVKRQNMALAVANAAKAKKEKLVEEVRRHFGFKVDPKDERFQTMLEEKEKQQQKVEKLAKKAAKEAKMIAAIQQKSAEITS